MPTYEFECADCGHKFTQEESFQEHDRPHRLKCPKCGSRKTKQLISPVFVKTTKKS